MKKLVGIFIFILLFIFISMYIMVSIDKGYGKNIEEKIIKNTNIKDIVYVNKYDNSYIVMDREYLYLFDSNYEEIYKVEVNLIHKNKNDYEIIYRDNTIMYMDNYRDKDGVIFKYYNIYTYELVDEIVVGGN